MSPASHRYEPVEAGQNSSQSDSQQVELARFAMCVLARMVGSVLGTLLYGVWHVLHLRFELAIKTAERIESAG